MKSIKMLLLGLFLIPLLSCEENDENETVVIKTDLSVDISLNSTIKEPTSLKSSVTEPEYSFTGTGMFCLAENKDLGKNQCEIRNISPDVGCVLTFSGITQGNKINTLLLRWDSRPKGDFNFDMQNEIDITSMVKEQKNGIIEIELTSAIIPLVNCIGTEPDCMYRIDLAGISNFDLASTAKLKIPVTVETLVYTTRFTLF